MRYFRILISDPKTGEILVPNYQGRPGFTRVPANANLSTYTSLNSGKAVTDLFATNPAAQMVELDIPVGPLHTPIANGYVRIHGVGLQEIAQASNLGGLNIAIFGGMASGLPLASPSQAGPLAMGLVFRAFGNWVGTSQTLDIYISAGGDSPSSNQTTGNPPTNNTLPVPATNKDGSNLVFQWNDGQQLLPPLVQCISTAYPQYRIRGSVSQNLVWHGQAATGVFTTLENLAKYINRATLNLLGGFAPNLKTYQGVSIVLQHNEIIISDGSVQTAPKPLAFQDLIGQPTYYGVGEVQATLVMRGDLTVASFVTLPPSLSTIQAGAVIPTAQNADAYSEVKNASAFTGTFLITSMRHVGNSRQAHGAAWATTIQLGQIRSPLSTVTAYPVLYKPQGLSFYMPGATSK